MHKEEIKQKYEAQGWVVVEEIFSKQEIENLLKIIMGIAEQEKRQPRFVSSLERLSLNQERIPRKINQPYLLHPIFVNFLSNERLLEILHLLLDDNPILATDQVFLKPPLIGSEMPYHQDNFFFKCEPANHIITAWIALDNVHKVNGCLRYINGSHLGPLLPHELVDDNGFHYSPPSYLINTSKEVPVCLPKGGVVFHHSLTLHASHANHSTHWRRGYATHWLTRNLYSDGEIVRRAYSDPYTES